MQKKYGLWIFLMVFFLCAFVSVSQASTISTGFITTPSYSIASGAGNMFNVNVLDDDLLVTEIDIHTSYLSGGNTSGTVSLYTRSGGYDNHTADLSGWNLIDSVDFTSEGFGNATRIDIDNFTLTGGTTGIYITLSEFGAATTRMRYQVKNINTTGNLAKANDDLEIFVGIGLTQPIPSASNVISESRLWNGSIHYSKLAPIPEPAAIFLFGIGLLGLAGVNRRKNS